MSISHNNISSIAVVDTCLPLSPCRHLTTIRFLNGRTYSECVPANYLQSLVNEVASYRFTLVHRDLTTINNESFHFGPASKVNYEIAKQFLETHFLKSCEDCSISTIPTADSALENLIEKCEVTGEWIEAPPHSR